MFIPKQAEKLEFWPIWVIYTAYDQSLQLRPCDVSGLYKLPLLGASMQATKDLIKKYYEAFNQQDTKTFLDFLSEDVIHDINQGERQKGKEAFTKFMEHMNRCYKEKVTNLVIMVNEDGTHAAAEFIIEGIYLVSDEGLPKAKHQKYHLPVGAFFTLKNNKITRVTNYYNLQDWIHQVSQ